MYDFVTNCLSWDGRVSVSREVALELEFWARNISDINGVQIQQTHAITKVAYSDASDNAYGGYIVKRLGNLIARGDFRPEEKAASSTVRELLEVKYVIESTPSTYSIIPFSGTPTIGTFLEFCRLEAKKVTCRT